MRTKVGSYWYGMGGRGEQDIMFYANNGCIAGRNPIWVQGTLMTLVQMFERVGIDTNMGKTKFMTCPPGFIWSQQGKEAYKRRVKGKGATFWGRNQTRVSCDHIKPGGHVMNLVFPRLVSIPTRSNICTSVISVL